MSEEEILNSKLDEERMLEIIEDLLQDPFHYFSKTLHKDTIQVYALSISVLKDLYKAEKEKNKKAIEMLQEQIKFCEQEAKGSLNNEICHRALYFDKHLLQELLEERN